MAQKIIRSSISYTIIQYLVLSIGFAKSIYVARELTPTIMGTYGLIILVLDYLRFAHLGIFSAMNLEASVQMGQEGSKDYIRQVTDNAFTYLVLMTIIFLLGAGIVKFLPNSFIDQDLKHYIFAIGFIAAVDQYKVFTVIFARLYDKYYWINRIEFWSNVLLFAIILALINRYKLDAVVWAMVGSSMLLLVLCLSLTCKHVVLTPRLPLIKRLLVIGAPLLIYNLCERVFMTIDRLIISHYFTRAELGYFTLSNTILSSTMVVLSSFTFLYYPKVLNKLNIRENARSLKEVLTNMKEYSALLGSVALAIGMTGIVLIKPFISIFLPTYENSILLYQILMLGVMADSLTYFASTFLASNKHQLPMISTLLLAAAVSIPLNIIFIRAGWELKGIAWATSLSMFFYAFAKISLTYFKLRSLNIVALFNFFKKYIAFCSVMIPILLWFPSLVLVGVPILILLYFKEFAQILRRIKLDINPA